MKPNPELLFEVLLRSCAARAGAWFARLRGRAEPTGQTPLRAELFSTEQMERHGRLLAGAHTVSRAAAPDRLLKRLDGNEQVLLDTCGLLTRAVKARERIAPAGEWLLDNFHLIEEQIRTSREHLPRAYSRELPRLARGPSAGLPRVYDLALEAISHGDGRVDAETLRRFVAAYQDVMPLALGELWAIPIMLRLALIENLRRVGAHIMAARIQLNAAQDWANRMMAIAESDPKSLILVIADMARSSPPMASPFVAELARRLQGHGPALALPLTWIEQRLAETSRTIEQMVQAETQQQAADQVSIGNTIGSLRFLGAMDWRQFVEDMSFVEHALRGDPGGAYAGMDFLTRDHYRHAVARLSRFSGVAEAAVAARAIALAQQGADANGMSSHTAHVGFYLADAGLLPLEAALGARLPLHRRAGRLLARAQPLLHIGSIVLLSLTLAGGLVALAYEPGAPPWRGVLIAVLALLGASQLASALANWLTTLLVTPHALPRMDYSQGLPPDMRTLVVVPTLISSAQGVDELLEALEVRYLGNRDAHLHFALLTDFCDAPEEHAPGDAALVQRAASGVLELNRKYAGPANDRFYLMHRPRRWNPSQGRWMGFERKRGKLADLNSLLRGRGRECFAEIVGDLGALVGVRYVITLDTDTQMPRDAARPFVAAMAHPLNRPRYDAARRRVCGGYGILQPSMAASLVGAGRSRYARLSGSEPGIDPYTQSVSDVYQDLFSEGSFIGKGIYDVDAFEQSLGGRLPDNRILSHDLLEGCYARAGLLSDLQLYEEYPARYMADVSRRKRWIRGDWQIACWMLPRVPGPQGERVANPLSLLSRWKIMDNLRRELVPGALLLLLLVGWCAVPRPLAWTVAVLGLLLAPPLLISAVAALRRPAAMRAGQHFRVVWQAVVRDMAQGGFRIACLPFEAMYSLEAILVASWRTLVTRRGLLEWCASSAGPSAGEDRLGAMYRSMWPAPVVAVAGLLLLGWLRAGALPAAAPVLCLWLAAPALAWWLSLPLRRREVKLGEEQTLFLRQVARRTWAYFERFVVAEDNWLAPDNFQEEPGPVIAHRTSPTNIGLALLSNLAASDFGYISAGSLVERTARTFSTMDALERHRGHFYNWYDTRTLQPLPPRYVSSVDSGNLAGLLLTLRAGLVALPERAIVAPRLFQGLADTLEVASFHSAATAAAPFARLRELLRAAAERPRPSLAELAHSLEVIAGAAAQLPGDPGLAADGEAREWILAVQRQCTDALEELRYLAPWLDPADASARAARLPGGPGIPTLRELARQTGAWMRPAEAGDASGTTSADGMGLAHELLALGAARAQERLEAIEALARRAGDFAMMEYEFLYDRARHLQAIGFNVDEMRRDASFYDLLASEARLGSFVAIAQGLLPQESWFALGRRLTTSGGEPVLVSWSGSMFEYLMPLLVMPAYADSLLEQTCRAAVARQIAYGNQQALPWGVSESGYNTVDASLNYQYHAFGVPGLGLKRGLGEDAVVAPYASALALLVAPEQACANLQRLAMDGLEGRFGFYEAIDFTPSRAERGQTGRIVRSFMAHHQGMSLLAIAHVLLDRPMQRRFESDPEFQATLLLLQERVPKTAPSRPRVDEHGDTGTFADSPASALHTSSIADTPVPEVQLLSNGRYHVMVTSAGGGYSRWKDLSITRWREDTTCDNWGSFVYLRDVASGAFWSATHQPTLRRAESYAAMFSEGRAEFRRRDGDIETYSEIVVSPEDDIELRRVRITNHAGERRSVELTSYAEVVLAPPAADAVQPGFGNLFVQTEIVRARHAILCTRRARSVGEPVPWMFHLLATHGSESGEVSYETDRVRFIGRGRTCVAPRALLEPEALSGTEGSVLDPVVAIRACVVLEPGESVTLDVVSGAAESREACLALVGKYSDRHLADRVIDLAWTHGGVTLRQINATAADAQLYRRLAGSVLYANAAMRAEAGVLLQNRRGQSGLWGYAISGDLPIVLLKIADSDHIELARQMIQCHAYWRLKGLVVDLVIWNEDHVGYRQRLQEQILGLIATGTEVMAIDRPGGIFVRSGEQISGEDRILLQAVARVIVADGRGSLAEQIHRRSLADKRVTRLKTTRTHRFEPAAPQGPLPPELQLGNGQGGFSADGTEYVIITSRDNMTPLPWVNVLANPHFGTVVSESGLAYTWSENAHEFRLTPWSDDALGGSGGEAIYLRDEESGHFWSPAPLPQGGAMPYRTRHGFGYSVFEHTAGGIRSELWVYVDLEESVKFSVLKVRNGSGRARRLSATGYVEWVLGDLRAKTALHVVTEIDPASAALFARNAYNSEFTERVAFFDVDDLSRTLSGDRTEFLGRNGTLARPDAMTRARLSGRLGAALDPCGAILVPFDLADGEEREIIFRLGAGRNLQQARDLAQRLRRPGSARAALERVQYYWKRTLGAVQVRTPDPALDLLCNGWLLYQTLACRLWARSGLYQSGGAYGFRDQLQDVMALVHTEPRLVREHLLRAAGRQFPEGDVQHWWHPPAGRGVRTRCSDDYLWLPLATCRYVRASGDTAVLEETVPFIEGRALAAEEESYYDLPRHSQESASLYQHCARAILHGLRFGEHGLPLMGSGDWNDGMNLVGIHGRGESVWLGFFLHEVLLEFAALARPEADQVFIERCRHEAEGLRKNLDLHAWDGEWYRRAWFDDGVALGSAANTECRIDSIAQSWSVLSGAGEPTRAGEAMESLDRHLVRRDVGVVQLLDPPFDTSALNPGYIKGYVPGVRENGGQYTHAAIWAAMAFAKLGDSRRAWELLGMINPLHHARSAQEVAVYKVEPYVVAADVYAVRPHTGRGGWTWYTGSAGWMYRLALESLLGVRREADRLHLLPCLPEEWQGYTLEYRFGNTRYHVTVVQTLVPRGEEGCTISLDGGEQAEGDAGVALTDDLREHAVELHLRRARAQLPAVLA